MESNTLQKQKFFTKDRFERLTVCAMLIILLIVFSFSSKYFFSYKNFLAIFMTVTVIGITAIGQSMVLMVRGFDMSVGMVTAFSGVICALAVQAGWHYLPAVLAALSFGAMAGFLNGFCVTKLQLPPMITTFVWSQIYRGALYLITNGSPIMVPQDKVAVFGFIGKTNVFGVIPLMVIIMLVLYCIAYFVITKTVFGRKMMCVGGNPEAAEVSGIKVSRIRTLVFMICSICAAIAGIVFASRVSLGNPLIGETNALDAVASSVLGGISMTGGKGNIFGTLLGVLTIGVIQNGLTMLNVQVYWQYIATGVIMLFAVILQLDRYK